MPRTKWTRKTGSGSVHPDGDNPFEARCEACCVKHRRGVGCKIPRRNWYVVYKGEPGWRIVAPCDDFEVALRYFQGVPEEGKPNVTPSKPNDMGYRYVLDDALLREE